MSSRSFPNHSAAVVLADKKRQKREARIRERYDRISAALINTDPTKFAAQHPTRVIPDVPGITDLQAAEVKKDFRDIEKHGEFMYYPLMDDEDAPRQQINVAAHPSNYDGSNVMAKMKRILAWKENSDLRKKEIKEMREKVQQENAVLKQHELEREEWLSSFEVSRKLLSLLIDYVQNSNEVLRANAKQLLQQCSSECNPSAATTATTTNGEQENGVQQRTIRGIVEELSRLEKEAKTKTTALASEPSKGRVAHAKPQPAQLVVKMEKGMEVDGEENGGDEDHVESLIKLLEDAQEAVLRCEAQEGDLDFFFSPPENDDQSNSGSNTTSASTNNNGYYGNTSSSSKMNVQQQVLLQRATQPSVKIEGVHQQQQDAAAIYRQILQQPTKNVLETVTQLFQSIDGASNVQNRDRKRRIGADSAINLATYARSRTERDELLLFSPLSQFEDRYLGTLPLKTLFHAVGPDRFVNILLQQLPADLVKAENDQIERYSIHSEMVHARLEIEKLSQSITELQRMTNESETSFQKAQTIHQQVLNEDAAEYGRMMQYLADQGLLGSDLHANNSFTTTAATAEALEAKALTGAVMTKKAVNSAASSTSVAVVAVTAASGKDKKSTSRQSSSNNATDSSVTSVAADTAPSSSSSTSAAVTAATAATTAKLGGRKGSTSAPVAASNSTAVAATSKGNGNSVALLATAGTVISNVFSGGTALVGGKRKNEVLDTTKLGTEVTVGSGGNAPAAKRRR